jgi:hypothetical protein
MEGRSGMTREDAKERKQCGVRGRDFKGLKVPVKTENNKNDQVPKRGRSKRQNPIL